MAKLKPPLRKAATRTRDALGDELGWMIDSFIPQVRGNFFTAAGFQPEQMEKALGRGLPSAPPS